MGPEYIIDAKFIAPLVHGMYHKLSESDKAKARAFENEVLEVDGWGYWNTDVKVRDGSGICAVTGEESDNIVSIEWLGLCL